MLFTQQQAHHIAYVTLLYTLFTSSAETTSTVLFDIKARFAIVMLIDQDFHQAVHGVLGYGIRQVLAVWVLPGVYGV